MDYLSEQLNNNFTLGLAVALVICLVLIIILTIACIRLGIKVAKRHPVKLAKKWANRAVRFAPKYLVNTQFNKELKADFGPNYSVKKR